MSTPYRLLNHLLLTLFRASILAPLSSRRATTSLRPLDAAVKRGVSSPYPRQREGSEIVIIMYVCMYVCMYAYRKEGVGKVVSGSSGRLPSLLPRTLNLASLSAEWSRRISTARRCPLQAARYRAVAPSYQRHSHTYILSACSCRGDNNHREKE